MHKFPKLNMADYQGQYSAELLQQLTDHPEEMTLEQMRKLLYGFAFTDEFVRMELPDELFMEHWAEQWEEAEETDELFDAEEAYKRLLGEEADEQCMLEADSLQEMLILTAIHTSGDGQSAATALCVIDVEQEYEYVRRVFPYNMLQPAAQALLDGGIDRLDFAENVFGVEHLYFDISARLNVGYGC